MENNTEQQLRSRVSPPLSTKDSHLGDLNLTRKRETIILNGGEWVGIENNSLIRIKTPFKSSVYNVKYYDIIGKDKTQQKLIEKALKHILPHIVKNKDTPKQILTETPKQVSTKTLDEELKQLETLTLLCKTLDTYHNREDTLKTTKDQDKKVLLKRQQEKQKTLIQKRLKELKSDSSFSIDGIKAHYKGQYVSAVKTINLGGFC
jgi:DNA-binding HxlR family transcriptional regulator